MAYCTPNDVAAIFPTFNRNQMGSISDAQITGWIADGAGFMAALFWGRGLNIDNLAFPLVNNPTQAQVVVAPEATQILLQMNRAYAVNKLGEALQGVITDTEAAIAKSYDALWKDLVSNVIKGTYDKFFWLGARTIDIDPGATGLSGGEVPKSEIPPLIGYNCAFYKQMEF